MASRASLSRATEAFLRQMAADGRTPMSIHSYQRQLASFAQAVGDVPLRRLTPDHLNGYLTSPTVRLQVDGTPKATSTINRGKSVIRAFFRWCELTGLIERNPAAHVRLARPPCLCDPSHDARGSGSVPPHDQTSPKSSLGARPCSVRDVGMDGNPPVGCHSFAKERCGSWKAATPPAASQRRPP